MSTKATTCYQKAKDYVKENKLRVDDTWLKEFDAKLSWTKAQSMSKAQFGKTMLDFIEGKMAEYSKATKAGKLQDLALVSDAIGKFAINKDLGLTGYEYIESFLKGGSLKAGVGTNIEIRNYERTLMSRFTNIYNTLSDIKTEIEHGVLDKEYFQARDALQRGVAPDPSLDRAAVRQAEVFHALDKLIFREKSARAPTLAPIEDHFGTRYHDRERITTAGKDQWVMDVYRLSKDKSFEGLTDAEKIGVLDSSYDNLVGGNSGFFKGEGGNIRSKFLAQRKIIFNDWQSEYEYRQKYGLGSASDEMMATMRRAARDIAIMEKMGAEYKENAKRIIDGVYKLSSTGDRAEIDAKRGDIDATLRTLFGNIDNPAWGMSTKIVQGLQASVSTLSMGMSSISSLPDLGTAMTNVANMRGDTIFSTMPRTLANYVKHLPGPLARETMSRLGLVCETTLNTLHRDLGVDLTPKTPAGQAASLGNTILSKLGALNLMQYHNNASKAGIAEMLAKDLAEMFKGDFADLHSFTKEGLARYNIGEPEAAVYRHSNEKIGNVDQLTPEGVLASPDNIIKEYLSSKGTESPSDELIYQTKSKLALLVGALYNEHATLASSEPNTRQRIFMYQGTSVNDPGGLARRLVWQFKGSLLSNWDAVRRTYYTGNGPKGNWGAVGQHAASLIVLTTIAKWAKDFVVGKTPEDPRDPKFALSVILQSGVGGIYGSILEGELEKNGTDSLMLGLLKGAVGPTISRGAELTALASQYATTAAVGKSSDKYPNARMGSFATSLLPNYFYTKAALNSYMIYGVRDYLQPGYLANLENGARKHGQEYLFAKPLEAQRFR